MHWKTCTLLKTNSWIKGMGYKCICLSLEGRLLVGKSKRAVRDVPALPHWGDLQPGLKKC